MGRLMTVIALAALLPGWGHAQNISPDKTDADAGMPDPGTAMGQPVARDSVSPSAPMKDADATAPAPAAPVPTVSHVATDPNYLLQPDDLISVLVFREPDLTTEGMVRKDGLFDMKLLGAVKVAGRTVDQATAAIRDALGKDYLVDPRVSVSILAYAKRKVNILGEVRSPGLYTFPEHGDLTLSDAIAMAGGFLPSADMAHVGIRRLGKEGTVDYVIDASAGAEQTGNKFALRQDDAINVAVLPKRHFTVLGQVNRPGTYEVADNRPVYLTDAVALAGGFTRIANSSRVYLKRIDGGHEVVLELNARAMAKSAGTQRMEIQNQDTITVSEIIF